MNPDIPPLQPDRPNPPPANRQDIEQPNISRLSVKSPPFWKQNPQLWFCQIEGQFATSGIPHKIQHNYRSNRQ